ncbi:hypothetical protein [uncultured Mucilaginibacter sp.]|uniref:hypothetical protein n=1 Tax=uncultured Mucilaginibacter sp. TaxID=797541 RepID=UPI0025F3462A|nr:hypothetical protein [uncultured Mucilaginibacter sp.]
MKEIVDFIEHLECPLIDGIIYSDHTIQLCDVQVSRNRPKEYKIQVSSITSVDKLEKEGKLAWVSCSISDEYIDEAHSIKVVCGEASYGGDGFVGVMNLTQEKLIWLAFFTNSNPFYKVTVVGTQIIAVSTHECEWKFDIDTPSHMSVVCSR